MLGVDVLASWLKKIKFQIARYKALRACYTECHLSLILPGCTFRDGQGVTLGYLEEVQLHRGRLYLRGWARVEELKIGMGRTHIWRQPREERDDVAAALGCDKHVGFRASLPVDNGPLMLELFRSAEDTVRVSHDPNIAKAKKRAEWRLCARFWRDSLPILPMMVVGILRDDPDLPRRVKAAMRLGHEDVETSLDTAFFRVPDSPSQAPAPQDAITLIMPIYNAFDLLPEALSRVMAHTDLPFRLILIEDASSDMRVRPWLQEWVFSQKGLHKVDLIENETNLGFIGAVNRGFELAQADSGPVVLLNSDAMLPAGWASRLIAPLSDPSVASTTPMSNDAEIFTAPVICAPAPLKEGQGDAIDAALQERVSETYPQVLAPTGVGFCMAMGRDWLTRLGGFDKAFGRGYGEEVDWCRRAAALGGKHVAVPRLFVEHRGGTSFGPEKQALVRQNNMIITARYPKYDRLVQDFIRNDPLVTPRLVAALAWVDSQPGIDELPVYLGHSMGGGAEHYLQGCVHTAPASLVLRFGGHWRCRIELDTPLGRVISNTDDLDLVVQLLAPIRKRRIIYSCVVGDPDLGDMPEFLLRLADGALLDVLFHDYLPISPSYTLLDHEGVYHGPPDEGDKDPAHCYRRKDGSVMPLSDWRIAWGRVVEAADRVIAFSRSSGAIVEAAYPQVQDRLHIHPHKLLKSVSRLASPAVGPTVIGVLGAIGPEKGAALLSALSERLRDMKDIDLALIGRIAPSYHLAGDVPIHGTYTVEDIPALATRYGVTHWLIPSVWPETFCYSIHECLATGLPTLAFDLGAQGEAVRKASNGVLLSWHPEARDAETLAKLVIKAIAELTYGDPHGDAHD